MARVWHGESRSSDFRARKAESLAKRRKAFLANYAHPERNLDFVESLEARRTESLSEDFDALNDIFNLTP